MNPGSIARDGYLTSVLGIAVRGYLGSTPVIFAYPVGAEAASQAGIVTVDVIYPVDIVGAETVGQAGGITVITSSYANIIGAAIAAQAGTIEVNLLLPGIPIENDNTFFPDQSGLTICSRSGMIAKPGQLVLDPRSGGWVLPKYVDEYQPEPEKYRTKDRTKGARRPEDGINWITTPVDPDDL